MITVEAIVWYLVVLDMILYNFIAWFDGKWYKKHYRVLSRHLPVRKGFAVYYFILVAWIGLALYRLGLI